MTTVGAKLPPNPAATEEHPESSGNGALSSNLAPGLETPRGYTKTKLALAGQLRSLREVLKRRGPRSRFEPCDQLLAKLAEDRFTLAVVGQFKWGKSTLMIAIIGREILPTGVLPLTSAITVLKFGPKERLLIFRSNSPPPFPEEVPIGSLAEYVTQRGNPGNQKCVKTACLELPLPFLRRGLEFVDTPGVGSAIQANTATTYGFLAECDAVLFVTSVDTPLSSVELELLSAIREHAHKIFFVLNKTDLLGDAERDEVLEFVSNTISHQMGTDRVRVFPLFARLALTGKRNGTAGACRQSGLEELEEALANFLSEEKASVFLAAIVERAVGLLERESVEFETIRRARAMETSAVAARLGAVQAQWRAHEHTRRQRFDELRTHLLAQVRLAVTPELQSCLSAERFGVARTKERRLAETVAGWQLNVDSDAPSLSEWPWTPKLTPSLAALPVRFARDRFKKQLELEFDSAILRQAATSRAWAAVLNPVPQGSRQCRVCRVLQTSETDYLNRLAAFLNDEPGRSAYARSQGLCLRHLKRLLSLVETDEQRRFLLDQAAQHFDGLAEDMQSYAMKTEALRRGLRNRDEEDAYWRGLNHLAGSKHLAMAWPDDYETVDYL